MARSIILKETDMKDMIALLRRKETPSTSFESNPNNGGFKVYDKVSWYMNDGKLPKDIVSYFEKLSKWLISNDLISGEGKEILEMGVNQELSLTSAMLNDKGNYIFSTYYNQWLRGVDISRPNFNTLLTLARP